MGALSLYLDFINLFLMLLRLVGDRSITRQSRETETPRPLAGAFFFWLRWARA